MMDGGKPEECRVCFENYDEAQRRPRTVPCGHTFCSYCIDDMIKNDQLTCPNCRANHTATTVTQFPISYAVEDFIKKLKEFQFISGKQQPQQERPKGIIKKLWSLVQDQRSSISSYISKSEEVLSQLGQYQQLVKNWKSHHCQLQEALFTLVEQNKAAIEFLEQEDINLSDVTTEGEAGKEQLEDMLGCLDVVTTAPDAVTAIGQGDECSVKVEDWFSKCNKLFPDVNSLNTSVKVQENIREILEVVITEIEARASPVYLGDSTPTIMDKVAKITGSVSVDKLNVEHLRRISEPVKKLVEAGLVLAIQQDQDGLRSSKISLENGKLYLHTLLYQPLSAHARTIQLSEVMDELDSSSTLAFLDLGWAGATRGRIHIRLRPSTGLARQFVLMCTGQQGPTYANTKLVSVGYKSRPGEYVAGGDYQYNDGRGGTPLLFDLLGEYRRSGSAGAVWSPRQLGDLSTQFCIITRDRTDGHQWGDVFGEVENGLDVLKAAVKLRNINEVTVVDCGLVLTL